jgi:tetrapyrrole methylase family protein/MazG family protein
VHLYSSAVSFFMQNQLTTICAALNINPLERGLQLLPATALVPVTPAPVGDPSERAWADMQGVGPYTPTVLPFPLVGTQPALIANVHAEQVAAVQQTLLQRYPATHPVTLVTADAAHVQHTTLAELTDQPVSASTFVFLPPLEPLADLRGDGLAVVVAPLLGPRGCPWDREQTHRSLRRELLEETHEVLEALDADDSAALSEELGDLLLQVLMHSEMARQAGEWSLGDVLEGITAKLIRRHPHIFGDTVVADTGEVLRNWDAIKQAERAAKGQAPRRLLDGISPGLPALAAAQKIIARASKAGFDADEISYTWNKIHEELGELRAAAENEPHADDAARIRRIEEEYGDVLLAVARLANWLHIDAESALRAAHEKFRQRFGHVERQVQANGDDLRTMSVAAKEALWKQAKTVKSQEF